MIDWFKRLPEKPAVAHLIRAAERFTVRLGTQFSAGITYFSVLALIPIAMLAFSFTGFFLVRLRPDLIPMLAEALTGQLSGVDEATVAQVEEFIVNTLSNFTAIGIAGLLSAVYAGAGWMNNLKDALNAQWRADFDQPGPQPNIAVKTLTSLLALIGLLVAIGVTFGLASVSTSLTEQVIGWLGLPRNPAFSVVFALVPVVFPIGAGWLTFLLPLPGPARAARTLADRASGRVDGGRRVGGPAVSGQFLDRDFFANNLAARFFGPIIVLMLFFNFFATLILFIAAWIATAESPAFEEEDERIRFAVPPPDQPEPEEPAMVPEQVAVRSVRIGTGAGYVTGAATGVGLGALIAFVAARIGRRHR